MTGMKEGAGEDPFADNGSESSNPTEQEKTGDTNAESKATDVRQTGQQQIQIPYKFRRDGVQDGRSRVPLFLQEDTKRAERDALRELEERFDNNVSLTDLREALVKVGLQHLDEAKDNLEQWGYGMTFDE
ncbi:hypothetical protein [Halococcus thailandensis]|uniref:Uncharacterized protein n=1 Tax=Halococcus thailandensis JCM 13552 TaxID=1227457 RepID=M0NEH1_9EURY|nr:hypothetical protein [Halococcus thailandensis]EMA56251.1 hypothetical protein C451_03284 [Halococcus thailandensis JCM 13552]